MADSLTTPPTHAHLRSRPLNTRERLMIGCLGALTPQIANLLVVDLEQVLSQANVWSAVGYLLRVIAMGGVGMFVAYLHDDETNKVKAFQFGMAAPAMLLATLNGSQLAVAQVQATKAESAADVPGGASTDRDVEEVLQSLETAPVYMDRRALADRWRARESAWEPRVAAVRGDASASSAASSAAPVAVSSSAAAPSSLITSGPVSEPAIGAMGAAVEMEIEVPAAASGPSPAQQFMQGLVLRRVKKMQ